MWILCFTNFFHFLWAFSLAEMVSDGGHSDLRMWRLSCIKQRQINRNSDRVLELYVFAVFVCLRGANLKIVAICWYGRSMISLSWTLQNWLLPGTSRRNTTALWCEFSAQAPRGIGKGGAEIHGIERGIDSVSFCSFLKRFFGNFDLVLHRQQYD